MKEFKYLGKPTNEPTRTLDLIDWTGGRIVVRLECSEFSTLCPVTGQPDYGRLVIEYVPAGSLAETKSLKLYLWSYREERAFNETLVDRIATDLFEQIQPLWLRATGTFHPRGGIGVTASAERGNPEHRPS